MDGLPGGKKRGMKREGGGGVCVCACACVHAMHFSPLLSLSEALCMESVLFTAGNKLIGADYSRENDTVRQAEDGCNEGPSRRQRV